MPYFIVTYDIEVNRVNKVRKLLTAYLSPVQNSVFQGEMTFGKYKECQSKLEKIIKKDADSIYFYRVDNPKNLIKEVMGIEKKEVAGNFL